MAKNLKKNLLPLPRSFYARDTIAVAQDMLGKNLVHNDGFSLRIGKIVEVEAYIGPHDLACHASKGLTKRTAVMFGEPGYAYVYLIYGIYHCLNVVTETKDFPAAVLIRALEPVTGIQLRTSGPGLLCKALSITRDLNGTDMISNRLFITDGGCSSIDIVATTRIGVDYAKAWAKKKLRFYIKNNPFISKK